MYPLILAATYRLVGIKTPEAVILLMFMNAFFFGAATAAMYALARLLFCTRGPAIIAAVLFAVHPLFLFYAMDLWDSMLSLSLFLWLTVAAFRIGRNAAHRSGTWAIVFGATMGLLILTNPSYALTCPILLALAFPGGIPSRRWRMVGTALCMCLLVVLPWAMRNSYVFDRAPFVRSGVGLQLWLGNAPGQRGWIDLEAYRLHPYFNRAERDVLLTLGEPAYNDLCLNRFRQLLSEDIAGFVIRTVRRIGYLFLGEPTQPVVYPFLVNYQWHGIFLDNLLLNATVSLLGLAGMIAAWRLHYRWSGIAALMFCTALPFIPTAVMDRYALPLHALLLLFAVGFLWMLGIRARNGRWPIVRQP
jgi:hypothetical protein